MDRKDGDKSPLERLSVPVPVVLASGSSTRRALLSRLIPRFETVAPRVDEEEFSAESAEALARLLARAKARDVAGRRPDALVIAADTVVECDGKTLGKPSSPAEARRMLALLAKRPHRVITAVHILTPDGRAADVLSATEVRMRPLTQQEIDRIVRSGRSVGYAGGYAMEEGDPNVAALEGSPSGVMGLPLEQLEQALRSLYPASGDESVRI